MPCRKRTFLCQLLRRRASAMSTILSWQWTSVCSVSAKLDRYLRYRWYDQLLLRLVFVVSLQWCKSYLSDRSFPAISSNQTSSIVYMDRHLVRVFSFFTKRPCQRSPAAAPNDLHAYADDKDRLERCRHDFSYCMSANRLKPNTEKTK